MMTRPALRALLLDLDGTVADTHEFMYACYTHAVRHHLGHDGERRLWEQAAGLPLQEVFAATFRHFGHAAPADVLHAATDCYRSYMRERDSTVRPFPEITETLTALRGRNVRLAIVTTKHRRQAVRQLEVIRLASLFEVVVAGDDCRHAKPHPEPFLTALAALGVTPAEAMGVGDTAHDIHGSRAAGLRAVAACWGTIDRGALLAAGPDVVAEKPGDLLALCATG
jgi:pyrophosphatase PpaX